MLSGLSYVVEGRVAVSATPHGTPEEVVEKLKEYEIRTVVSLGDAPTPATEQLEAAGIKCRHIPLSVYTPPSLGQMDQVAAIVDDDDNCPVLLHCSNGIRLSGVMAAVAVKALELAGNIDHVPDAVAAVRAMRPGSVEASEQLQAFRQWESVRADPTVKDQLQPPHHHDMTEESGGA